MQAPRAFPPAQRIGSATRSVAAAVLGARGGSAGARIDPLPTQSSLFIPRYVSRFPHRAFRVNGNRVIVASAPLSLLQRFWTATSSTLCNALSPVPYRRNASFSGGREIRQDDYGNGVAGEEGSGQGSTPPIAPESPSRSLRQSDLDLFARRGRSRADWSADAAPRHGEGASEPPMVSGAGIGGGVGGAGVSPTTSALGRPGIGAVPSSSASGAGTSGIWGEPSNAQAQESVTSLILLPSLSLPLLSLLQKRPKLMQGPTLYERERRQEEVLRRKGGMRKTSSLPKLTSPQEQLLGSMPPMRRYLVDMIIGCDFIDILSREEVEALAIVPVSVAEQFLRRMPSHPHRRMSEPGAGERLFDESRQAYLEVRIEEDVNNNRQPKIAAIDVCAEPGYTVAHRQLGRDRILRVTFPPPRNSNQGMTPYVKFLQEGLVVGLRRFHFLGFKASQGNFKSGEAERVFMFALRSIAPADANSPAFPLYPSIKDVWNRFAHFHTCPTIQKTAARIELLFSRTYSLMDLQPGDVQVVPDVTCQDGSIPTDGTGLILASAVPPIEVASGVAYLPAAAPSPSPPTSASAPSTSPPSASPVSSSPPFSSSSPPSASPPSSSPSFATPPSSFPSSPSPSPSQSSLAAAVAQPAVLQVRGYLNGMLFKGTLLLVTQFPDSLNVQPGVKIVVRESMVKVTPDPVLLQAREGGRGQGRAMPAVNKLEVNDTSKAPSEATFNRTLLLLLVACGVPQDLFLSLARQLCNEAMALPSDRLAASKYILRSVSNLSASYAASYVMQPMQMIASGIPLSEPYLQDALHRRVNKAAESLEKGHLPADRSYYLMGVADPTATLLPDQVVVLLKDGPVTGPCLMYRSPSLHPGHLRMMNAVHSPAIAALLPPGAHYCVIFPVTGRRSVADTMSGGDLDGDKFMVCFHPQVTGAFKEVAPPARTVRGRVSTGRAPAQLNAAELEGQLLSIWGRLAAGHSVTGRAYNLHLSYLDEHGPQHEFCEQLMRIYERALDAPKTGEQVSIPHYLERIRRPHYMEAAAPAGSVFHSRSIMGQIYDLVQQARVTPSEADPLAAYELDPDLILTQSRAPSVDLTEKKALVKVWKGHWHEYKQSISSIYSRNLSNKQRDLQMQLQKEHYRKILYEGWSPSFEEPCAPIRLLRRASVIYEVVYSAARQKATRQVQETSQRGTSAPDDALHYRPALAFAWNVAGELLCEIKARRSGKWFLASQKQFLLMSMPGGRHGRWGGGEGGVRRVVTVGPEGRVVVIASQQGDDGDEGSDGCED
ncbi:unnamed protein product [Closterium sp. Yama58-4]|nr:unnamed protein product [Closterium sp. Yama58-4]